MTMSHVLIYETTLQKKHAKFEAMISQINESILYSYLEHNSFL